jgi:KaiC/GvpD/RAD55 family RecA-like ATPase
MTEVLGLPLELKQFLGRNAPRSLLVRGAPGTGKSMLVAELLRSFPGRGVYVSGRTRRTEVLTDLQALSSDPPENGHSIISVRDGSPVLSQTLQTLESAAKLVVSSDPGHELRSLLLPLEVLEAWNRTSPTEPTLVILDPWDAIVERHIGRTSPPQNSQPSRGEIERIMIAQMTEGSVFLVVVVEHREGGQLEYLVDGVVTLEKERYEDRLERWLRIDKLRGELITHPSYPFSLAGGRFRCIEPLRGYQLQPPTYIEPAPRRSPTRIWPGSTDYDTYLGPIPVSKLTLIEYDADVPTSVLTMMLDPIIGDVLEHRGRVFYVPPPGVHPAEVWITHSGRLTKELLGNQIRILDLVPRGEPTEIEHVMIPLPAGGAKGFDPRTPEAIKFLSENPAKESPNLVLEWVSGLKAINSVVPDTYTPEILPGMALSYLNLPLVHTIWVGGDDEPLTHSLREMATTRFRLIAREGRVLVHGIIPHTLTLVLSEGDESAPYHLLPVV